MPHSPVPGAEVETTFAKSGVEGFDQILNGGFTPNRFYLVEGVPGSGKTTLALQFLLAGLKLGESVLYVTLSETEEELHGIASSHGWSLSGVNIRQLVPSTQSLDRDQQLTMFHPSEVELSETSQLVINEIERVKPSRVVLDSLSELRLLAGRPLQYRRQVLALKQFFAGRHCTVLVLDDGEQDLNVQSIAHAVIRLEKFHPEYGAERRRMRLVKYRGVEFRGGYHDFVIRRGGLRMFPRLVAADTRHDIEVSAVPSGLKGLDDLLGGGLTSGTSTLITGAAGSGKSSLAALFVAAAAARGQRAAMFVFDESASTLLRRAEGLGIDLRSHVTAGRVLLKQVDPAELAPGEFAHEVLAAARDGARVLVIDSLNGYLNAMPEERFLTIQLHEMLTCLNQLGVATLLISVQHGLVGSTMISPVDASYLADAVILLRYFEAGGEVRQAISVVKKRGGNHERTIREFRLEAGGIRVGEPLQAFRGVLTGVPTYEGTSGPLLNGRAV